MYIPPFHEMLAVSQSQGLRSKAPSLWRGCVGYWPLREGGGGTAFDLARGNRGTHNGDPTHAVGRYGRCLGFDGVDDYVDVGAINDGTVPYGIDFWIYLEDGITSTNNQKGVFNTDYAAGSYYPQLNIGDNSSQTTDATIELWYADRDAGTFPRTYIKDTFPGGWHHLGVSWSVGDSEYYVYVDGVKRTTYPSDGGYGHVQASQWALNDLVIGRDYVDNYAAMKLNDFRIYNRPLLHSEIQQLYERPWVMTARRKPVTTFVMNRPISKKVLLLKRNSVTTLIH